MVRHDTKAGITYSLLWREHGAGGVFANVGKPPPGAGRTGTGATPPWVPVRRWARSGVALRHRPTASGCSTGGMERVRLLPPPTLDPTDRAARARLLGSGAVQRVLITGADGFAGRHLRSALEQRGSEAIASTADVRDAAALAAEVQAARPDAVAHLAAFSSVADAWSREGEVWEVNALGTLNVVLGSLMHAPQARPARRFVG